MEERKIRFAILGTAGIGRQHNEGIDACPMAELTAVCDIVEESAKACAEKNHLDTYYTDYRDMYAAGGFDCVIVCTPDQVHKDQVLDALAAGYHVLCEKPLAMEMEDCRAMVDAAKKSDKVFMVGQVCRKAPAFRLAKELVDAGEIGNLYFVESEYAHDYSLITTGGEWRRDPVHLRRPMIGGGCHAMDLLRWIAGNPLEVFAYSNHKVLTDWPVEDCTVSILKYPNDVIGKVMCSIGCKRPYTMHTVLYGDQGTILCDNTSPLLTVYRNKTNDKGARYFEKTEMPVEVNNHNMASEIEDMCNVILHGAPLETGVIEGANTVAVCRAAVDSAETGKPIVPQYFH